MHAVEQSAALRALFATVYAERRPGRVAILGCSTGADLQQVDDAVTQATVGVDLNPDYLVVAGQRLGPRLTAPGSGIRLILADVLQADLPERSFDLIHAALLLEYVEPDALMARVSRWLAAEGTFSVITQEPNDGLPAVSDSGYPSLRALSGHMVLRPATEVVDWAGRAGFRLVARDSVGLPSGKVLVGCCFQRARG